MIVRGLAVLILAWLAGFAWFAVALPQPLAGRHSDAIVVLTGGAGRIDRGLALMQQGAARQMLITGVDRDVRPRELAAQYHMPMRLFDCCITLGREAVDTRSNGVETAGWIKRRKYHSVRLITTDWHMRRGGYELRQALPADVTIAYDAVASRPSLAILVKEYHKYLLRRAAGLVGI